MQNNMRFKYNYARYPNNSDLMSRINSAAHRLHSKINDINIDELTIGKEIHKYFQNKVLFGLNTNLIKYAYHLAWSIGSKDIDLKNYVIVDHGGGTGIFGMLAKELGIGTVIYNDINEKWTEDARTIAKTIGNESDYYIAGDIDTLVSFVQEKSIDCNAIVSYNVIEHIYNIEVFLSKIHRINSGDLLVFMSTGANEYNPIIKRQIVSDQIRVEYGIDKKGIVVKNNPYRSIRESIIRDLHPQLPDKEIIDLSISTRGMKVDDIEKTVKILKTEGKYPDNPKHPTNTCNPHTGYWAEHLMNPFELERILESCHYDTQVLVGYYGRPNRILNRIVGYIANIFLYFLKNKGLMISPYWTIYARKTA